MMHNVIAPLQIKTVDRFNQEKLYIQLTRIFQEQISSGIWPLGQRIPTEDDLCRQYIVSKITIRQAIQNLVSDGYLMKIQGKGTFVTSVLPLIGLAMKTRFTEEKFGREVEAEKELLFQGVAEPPAGVRAYLKTDDRIYRILCRRNVGGKPAYLDESFVPCQVLSDIEDHDFSRVSLYLLLQDKGNRKIFKIIQTVEIIEVRDQAAKYLELQAGMPVLAIHRLLSGPDDAPVAYIRLLGRSDRYKFQTEFERIR